MYVYIRSEPQLFTVGHYSPDGRWHTDSDWNSQQDARERVHWLNGDNTLIGRVVTLEVELRQLRATLPA